MHPMPRGSYSSTIRLRQRGLPQAGSTFFGTDSYIYANTTVMQDKDVILLYNLLPSPHKQAVRDFIEFLYQKTAVAQHGADPVPLRGALGSMKGQVWMAPDFDAPLEDFREYME